MLVHMLVLKIADAAANLCISTDTVRRRLKSGDLKGRKEKRAGGYVWVVEVAEPEDNHQDEPWADNARSNDNALVIKVLQDQALQLKDQVLQLTGQLDSRTKEISELHQIIGARALNPGRSWWMLWRR